MLERIAEDPQVKATYDRMVEIVELIKPTQSDQFVIEYSALIAAGVIIVGVAYGVEPSRQQLSALIRVTFEEIVPVLKAALEAQQAETKD